VNSTWKIWILTSLVTLACGLLGWQGYRVLAYSRRVSESAEACRKRAEQGDAKAEFELSNIYFYGAGVPQSSAEGFRWARKAAEDGLPAAEYSVASSYYHGLGVSQNFIEALRWFRLAADKGDAASEYGLGYMYRHGLGVKQNNEEGIRWFQKSAEHGYATAQFELGFLYRKGDGVSLDYAQAAGWYQRAADQGNAEGESGIGFMEFYGYGVPENRREANRWFHKAAEQGDAYARDALGIVWLGMTTTQLTLTLVQIVGGVLLLIGSLIPKRNRIHFRSSKAPWAGCLCFVSAASWWYGYNHYFLRSLNGGMNAFNVFKFIIDGLMIVLLVRVLRGERKQSSGLSPAI
jgi:TPR repeat protein